MLLRNFRNGKLRAVAGHETKVNDKLTVKSKVDCCGKVTTCGIY